jgi:hypothetical protein
MNNLEIRENTEIEPVVFLLEREFGTHAGRPQRRRIAPVAVLLICFKIYRRFC